MDNGIDHPSIEFRSDDFFDNGESDLLFRAEMMMKGPLVDLAAFKIWSMPVAL